jgi:hypothetical protein
MLTNIVEYSSLGELKWARRKADLLRHFSKKGGLCCLYFEAAAAGKNS